MKPVLNEKVNLYAWALNNQQMVSFFMLLIIAMGRSYHCEAAT